MDCPNCIGQMELKSDPSGDVYQCPLCGTQRSARLVDDERRWWGPVHLPLVDILRNPPAVFRQLKDHPVALTVLIFYVGSIATQRYAPNQQVAMSVWKSLLAPFPLFGHFGMLLLTLVSAGLIINTVFTAFLYGAVKMIGDEFKDSTRVPYKSLWTIGLFLSAITALLYVIPLHNRVSHWFVLTWSLVWELWAIRTLYRFSILQSVGAYALSSLLSIVVIIVLALIAALGLSHTGMLGQKSLSRNAVDSVDTAADYAWHVQRLDGSTLDMNQLKGKVIFLNFWATWCGPCRMEMSGIQKLYDHFKANPDVVFLSVSQEPLETIRQFAKTSTFTFPLYSGPNPLPTVYQSIGIPMTYIISRQGKIVGQHIGAEQWDTDENVQRLNRLAASSNQ